MEENKILRVYEKWNKAAESSKDISVNHNPPYPFLSATFVHPFLFHGLLRNPL
jgi:hypothetical protein